MPSISWTSCWYSASMKARSVLDGTPDSDWAASAFMRCSTSPIRARPPSATCRTEEPCEALIDACWRTLTSALSRVLIARPAASSDAFTIREPDESFDTELLDCAALMFKNRSAELAAVLVRSEEHTSELQSLMRISYAVFCLKKKNIYLIKTHIYNMLDDEINKLS